MKFALIYVILIYEISDLLKHILDIHNGEEEPDGLFLDFYGFFYVFISIPKSQQLAMMFWLQIFIRYEMFLKFD